MKFEQRLQGEFLIFLLLFRILQQLSEIQSISTIPFHCLSMIYYSLFCHSNILFIKNLPPFFILSKEYFFPFHPKLSLLILIVCRENIQRIADALEINGIDPFTHIFNIQFSILPQLHCHKDVLSFLSLIYSQLVYIIVQRVLFRLELPPILLVFFLKS